MLLVPSNNASLTALALSLIADPEERSGAQNHAQSDGRSGLGTAAALAMAMDMAPTHLKSLPMKMSG
jgi:hypothetical protein